MNKKHIAIITSYPFPDEPVIRNRITAYVNVLLGSGWKVTIIAASSRTTDAQWPKNHTLGCNIVYVPIRNYDRKNYVIRALNEIKHSWQLLRKTAELHPDIALVTIPSIFLLLFAMKRFAYLHVVDVRDLVWEYLPRYPWWKGIPRCMLKLFAFWALSRADVIALSNPHELEYVRQKLSLKRLLLVSNGIGKEQFYELSNLVHEPGQEGILRITYLGNVGIAQNLLTLIEAVAGYKQLHVNIVGSGTDFDRICSTVQQYNAENVHLHGQLSWEKAVVWYTKSDVLYAQLSPAFATAMPSKLYEYLATGLPVVYGGKGTAIEILKSFSGVTVVEPNSSEHIRMALLDMLEHKIPTRLVDNIELIHRHYIREDQVNAIERVISEYLK